RLALTVQDAPADANLTPGQEFGSAPGRVLFPVSGTYRLTVTASGYAPGTLSVTVPRETRKEIVLGE
ncbi:PEGA domain-containing protein, partial [Deinococcus sp. 14RED07]